MAHDPRHQRTEPSIPKDKDYVPDMDAEWTEDATPPAPHFAPPAAGHSHNKPRAANAGHPPAAQSRPKPKDDDRPQVPGYGILGVLGEGPMGTVYKAKQASTGRTVALKVIASDAGMGRHEQGHLLAAVESVASLQHPHIAPVYECGRWEDGLYFAGELLEGESLAAGMKGMPQHEREAAELIETLAQAVHFCHQRRIIHRNLKPSNILYSANDVPKITDFAVARHADAAQSQTAAAAIAYMSPEVAQGGEAGPAADVYSLGAILYEMLTGRPPFLGESPAEAVREVLEQEPVPPRRLRPKISPVLETICLKCLQKEAQHRYHTAEALAEDLHRFLEYKPIEAQPAGPFAQAWQWCQKKPLLAGAATVLAVLLIVGLGSLRSLTANLSGDKDRTQREKSLAEEKAREAQKAQAAAAKARQDKMARDAAEKARQDKEAKAAADRVWLARRNLPDLATPAKLPAPKETLDPQRELEKQRSLYAAQIRLAKQARDRGDLTQARQILEPYRTTTEKQNLRNFAWYLLWRGATAAMDNMGAFPVGGNQEYEVLAGTPSQGWLNDLVFAPGGDQLIGVGCEGPEALVSQWNLADAAHPVSLQTTSRLGTAMGFSPDGRLMAIGEESSLEATSPARLRIWNLQTGQATATLPGMTGRIVSAVYSPDARLLAAALGDFDERVPGQVRLWDMATGNPGPALPDQFGRVEAAFSPDAKLLVTVAGSRKRPGEICLWNPATGQLLGRMDNARELESLTTMALSPDGHMLVTGHGDLGNPMAPGKAKLKVWDVTKRQLVAQFPPAHPATITSLAFTRRGKLLASGDFAGNIRVWDFAQRKLLPKQAPTQGPMINSLAFDLPGDRLASGGQEKCVRVWHVDTGRQLARLDLSVGGPAVVRFAPDGKSLVATTTAGGLIVWNADNYQPRGVLQPEGSLAGSSGHEGEVTCIAASPAAGRLITGGADRTVKFWDLRTGKFQATAFTCKQPVCCLAVSPDGRKLAIGTGRYRTNPEVGELILLQFAPGVAQPTMQVLNRGMAPTSMAFTPDGEMLAVCAMSLDSMRGPRYNAVLFTPAIAKAVTLSSRQPQSVAIAPDGRLLAAGRNNGEIELWPLQSFGGLGATPKVLPAHQGPVAALGFSPDGKALVSGGSDRRVKVWDVAGGEELLTLEHNGPVETVRFSPDGKVLAAAERSDLRGSVRLWRAAGDDR